MPPRRASAAPPQPHHDAVHAFQRSASLMLLSFHLLPSPVTPLMAAAAPPFRIRYACYQPPAAAEPDVHAPAVLHQRCFSCRPRAAAATMSARTASCPVFAAAAEAPLRFSAIDIFIIDID
jgi:hypothetical protein